VGRLDTARQRGLYEGLLGGNRRWLVLGGVAWTVRAVGWAIRRDERVLYRERLRPGEQLVITERQRQPKRSRRAR
jgi:hypothetical protein